MRALSEQQFNTAMDMEIRNAIATILTTHREMTLIQKYIPTLTKACYGEESLEAAKE